MGRVTRMLTPITRRADSETQETQLGELTEILRAEPDLAPIIRTWPQVSKPVRKAILTILEASAGR